jgi:Cu+-exporting ATPase
MNKEVSIVSREILTISGMACPACAKSIEKVVGGLKGVSRATVSFDRGELALDFDERRFPGGVIYDIVAGIASDVVEETRKMSASFPLSGLSCPECAARIEEILEKKEGVINASVSLKKGRVSVTYDPKKTEFSRIKNATRDARCAEGHRQLQVNGDYACGCCGESRMVTADKGGISQI